MTVKQGPHSMQDLFKLTTLIQKYSRGGTGPFYSPFFFEVMVVEDGAHLGFGCGCGYTREMTCDSRFTARWFITAAATKCVSISLAFCRVWKYLLFSQFSLSCEWWPLFQGQFKGSFCLFALFFCRVYWTLCSC